MADKTGSWELCRDKKFLVSGLTRAKTSMYLILINYPYDNTELTDIATVGSD